MKETSGAGYMPLNNDVQAWTHDNEFEFDLQDPLAAKEN